MKDIQQNTKQIHFVWGSLLSTTYTDQTWTLACSVWCWHHAHNHWNTHRCSAWSHVRHLTDILHHQDNQQADNLPPQNASWFHLVDPKFRLAQQVIITIEKDLNGGCINHFSAICTHACTHTHCVGITLVNQHQNQSGFYWNKRQWVAMASAGPYANLHLAPDSYLRQHPTTRCNI